MGLDMQAFLVVQDIPQNLPRFTVKEVKAAQIAEADAQARIRAAKILKRRRSSGGPSAGLSTENEASMSPSVLYVSLPYISLLLSADITSCSEACYVESSHIASIMAGDASNLRSCL